MIFGRKKDCNGRTKAERLYFTYRRLMFKEAYAILENKALAEDAVHMAMERIIKNQEKVSETDFGRARNFCCTIARNEACRLWAKEHKIAFDDFEDAYELSLKDTPLDTLVEKETKEELSDCINRLKPIYYDVMTLKFYNELTDKEIAKALHITEATVRKRYERAKKQLREMLEKEAEKYEKY